jgi:hypothetical protein
VKTAIFFVAMGKQARTGLLAAANDGKQHAILPGDWGTNYERPKGKRQEEGCGRLRKNSQRR